MKVKAPNMLKKIIEALSSKTNELRIRMMIFFLLHKNLDKSSLTSSLQALVSHHPHHHRKKKNDDVFDEDQLVGNREDEQEEEGYEEGEEEEEEERSKASLLMNYYNKASMDMVSNTHDHMNNIVENMSRNHQVNRDEYDYDDYEAEEEVEKHPTENLTRSLFEESKAEMEMEGESGEVAVAQGGGQRMMDGVEEEEPREDIDQAADLFIQRFKKQMLLQKQRSLERQQWLLLSNA